MNACLGAEAFASPSKGARTRGNGSTLRDEDRNVFAPERRAARLLGKRHSCRLTESAQKKFPLRRPAERQESRSPESVPAFSPPCVSSLSLSKRSSAARYRRFSKTHPRNLLRIRPNEPPKRRHQNINFTPTEYIVYSCLGSFADQTSGCAVEFICSTPNVIAKFFEKEISAPIPIP